MVSETTVKAVIALAAVSVLILWTWALLAPKGVPFKKWVAQSLRVHRERQA